jgi:hypothetical protein
MDYVTDMLPLEPTPFTYSANKWPRRNDVHFTTLKYARPLASYEIATAYYPISCRYFHDLARKDFWSSFVRVYGETGQALYLGQLATGSQYARDGAGKGKWKWQAPPPHAAAQPLNLGSKDSIIAHTIQTGRIQYQNRAIAALKATRGALSDWRAKYLSKKEKHDWYEQQRAREEMGVEGPPPDPGNSLPYPYTLAPQETDSPQVSPLSSLTIYSPTRLDPEDQSGDESDFSHEAGLPNAPPERHEYIHTALCNLRLVLALDSMHNRVPINLLLEYLNRELIRLRRSVVGPEEFEQYLRHVALEKKICFKYATPIPPIYASLTPPIFQLSQLRFANPHYYTASSFTTPAQ